MNKTSLGTAREEFEIGSGYWRKWQRCEKEKADLLEAAKVALIVFRSMMEDPDFKPEATRDQIQQAIDKAEAPLEGKS